MRPFLLVVLCGSLFLTGCSFLGLYRYKEAERAPPEEAAAVKFPNSLAEGPRLTGAMMAALKVAMDDYRPPSINPDALKLPEDRCLARWENINTTVLQANENLFFIRFSPDLSKCAPGSIMLDVGAVYAIDGQGRILGTK